MTSQRLMASAGPAKPPNCRPGYSRQSVTNCTRGKRSYRADDYKRRQRRAYQQLLRGMRDEESIFFTLTNGQDRLLLLRSVVWHRLRAYLYREWPGFQACSVYEFAERRGVHLHVVIKHTPGLTLERLQQVVGHIGNGNQISGWREVYDVEGLAAYLTKDLGDPVKMEGWPRHFRPVTFTREWCPGWLSRQEWAARRAA